MLAATKSSVVSSSIPLSSAMRRRSVLLWVDDELEELEDEESELSSTSMSLLGVLTSPSFSSLVLQDHVVGGNHGQAGVVNGGGGRSR